MPPSIEELRNRITKRGTESPEVIEERLRKATEEIPLVFRYDYVVLNQNLEEAAAMVRAIILAERSRVAKAIARHSSAAYRGRQRILGFECLTQPVRLRMKGALTDAQRSQRETLDIKEETV